MANVQLQSLKSLTSRTQITGHPGRSGSNNSTLCTSGLSETEEAQQIGILLYSIGPEAECVLDSINITTSQFFHVGKNTIFKWTIFSYHCQGEDETYS